MRPPSINSPTITSTASSPFHPLPLIADNEDLGEIADREAIEALRLVANNVDQVCGATKEQREGVQTLWPS